MRARITSVVTGLKRQVERRDAEIEYVCSFQVVWYVCSLTLTVVLCRSLRSTASQLALLLWKTLQGVRMMRW